MNGDKWKTKGIVINNIDEEYLVFGDDYTLKEIKKLIIDNCIFLCRKSECQNTCHYYQNDENIKETPCLLMKKILDEIIQTTSNFVYTKNPYHVEKYIKSVISLLPFFRLSEIWKGTILSKYGDWFYRGFHTSLYNTNSMNLISLLHSFILNFDFINTNQKKDYVLFVEGHSESESFKDLVFKMGILSSFDIICLGGKDSTKRKQLEITLKLMKKQNKEYFIILDGVDSMVKNYKEDLVRENLIKNEHFIFWEKEFEDSFPPKIIYLSLKEVIGKLPFTFKELENELKIGTRITRAMSKLFFLKKKIPLNYNSYKVEVAKIAIKSINKNTDCELIKKINLLKNIYETEMDEFYFRDPELLMKPI